MRESRAIKNKKVHIGVNTNFKIYKDPLQFFISLARYKFVSKIFLNKKSVLVGCSDAFNSKIVAQTVKKLTHVILMKIYLRMQEYHQMKNSSSMFSIIIF